jgi:hypothetical protein
MKKAEVVQANIALVDASKAYLNLTSAENGWGTYWRMEGSQLYSDESAVRKQAIQALKDSGVEVN